MKKSGICLFFICASIMALDNNEFTEQEKPVSDEKLAELEQQKQAMDRKKLFWQVVTGLGAAGLMSFLVYKIFIGTPVKTNIIPPLLSAPVVDKVDEQFPLQEVQKDRTQEFVVGNEITSQISDIPEVPITKKLTPEEIALYRLRYENLRAHSAAGFLSLAAGLWVAGPIALPIDVLLFSWSLLFGGGALYYKKKLNP